MKRICIYSMAVAAIMMVSCSKEVASLDKEIGESSVSVEALTLSASSDEAVSKTSLDGKSTVWCGGESISVFSCEAASPANHEFAMVGAPSGSSAHFSGEVEEGTDNIVAVYPYAAGNSFVDGVVSAVLPVEQSATAGSFADGASLLYYKGAKEDGIRFRSACTIVYFTLPSDITFASSVTISANNGAKIAGACTIDKDGNLVVDQVNGSATVVLNGSFAGGNKYYATIAPGTYAGGFNFTVATAGGNTYLRTNALDMTLEANAIHNLGTLALLLDSEVFTAQSTITNDIVDKKLNGSSVAVRLNMPKSEFADAVTNVSWTAQLKRGDDVVRSVSGTGFNTDVLMTTVENGYYYLPAGAYTLEIRELSYTSAGKKRTIPGLICSLVNVVASAPAPGTLNVVPVGYTSYSTYKGLDGRTSSASDANAEDGSTIYGVGYDYSSAFSENVLTQCASMISASSTLDGVEASGDVSGQLWEKHTIAVTMTFDGVAHSAYKDVHVTGLPYNKEKKKLGELDHSQWKITGGSSKYDNDYLYVRDHAKAELTFYIPSNVLVYVDYDMSLYISSRIQDQTMKFNVGDNQIINDKQSGTAKTVNYNNSSVQSSLSSSFPSIWFQADGNSTSWAVGQAWAKMICVNYR